MGKSFKLLLLVAILISSLIVAPVTNVYAISIPAEINKQFTPIFIDAGGVSVLRVSIFNPNTFPLTNASWSDNLVGVQPGLSIANPAGIVNTCGGAVTAVSGTTSLSLSAGTVPAQVGATPGECYVEINVTSTTPGNLINTIPPNNLVSTGNDGGTPVSITNTTPASATLTVIAVTPPTLTKGFAPATITMGNFSTLTITVNNNDADTNLTGTSYTDTLPANVVLANPVMPTLTNCGGAATLTAPVGGSSIALSNATVTPSLNCVVTVRVTSAVQGVYPNSIPAGPAGPGSIRTTQGVTNPAAANATLNVQPINITKAFNPTAFQAGGTSTLTITVQNPTAANYTGVSLSDTLPTIPNTNLTYVPGSAATTCAGGTATNTTTTVTLTGGTVPANSTCTITVNVTTPAGATAATYTNIIPPGAVAIASNPGATTVIQTTANVIVYATGTGMTGSVKSFTPDPISAGGNTRLRIDLIAPADTNLTNFSMTDNLPAGVTISNSTAPAISGCGAAPPRVLTTTTGSNIITLTGGTILAGATCRIDVWVTSSTPGTVTNTITPANISNNQNRDPAANLTDTLTVNSVQNLSMSKAFSPPTVDPDGLSVLTITLQNTYPSPLINVSLTDPLPGSVTDGVVVAPVPNPSTTCTGGTVTAVPGSQTITMTAGIIPAQVGAVPGICTITVTVQGKDSNAAASNRVNTIPIANVSGTVQSTGTVINPIAQAQATLRTEILSIGVVKGFNPVLVYGGASSTMSIQLINPNAAAVLTGINFTDDMTLLGTGMIIANPANLNVGTCGGVLTGNPGNTSFSFSGGTLAANTSCTLTLRVSMSVNGNLTNRIPAGAVTTFNGATSPDPAEASLTNLPGASVSKAFGPNPVLAAAPSTLTITIQNTTSIPLSAMGLSDALPGTLPAGLAIANPSNLTNTCGGTVTAAPGSQTIQLAGGALGGNLSCTISVNVVSTVPGSYINTIPQGALTNAEGATNNNPATDTLVVTPATFSLGNRVWFDTDNSGTINGTEVGVNGVTVQVYAADAGGNPTGAVLGTQTTANGGYYRFDNLPAGNYVVVIPATQFGTGGVLDGYWSSNTAVNGTGALTETTAPDPDNNLDSDDNGTLQTAGAFNGAVLSNAITLGPTANEPTNDTDADPTNPAGESVNNQSNRTVDFGFYRQELGDQIFVDVNNNGTYDAGDTALAGATVRLYASNGTTEINVGPDGIFGTADDAAGGVITGAVGTYLFRGLPQGDYVVRVTPPVGYASTVDTADATDTTTPNINTNNNDNGVGTAAGQASSNAVTLTPGSFGAALNNNVANATGTTTNPTVDFGFVPVPVYSLGNQVWFDTDNSGAINGTEVGVGGVRVELYQDNGGTPGVYDATDTFIGFATTDANGFYRFDNLLAGDYVVKIPTDNFRNVGAGDTVPGDPLAGYLSSGTTISAAGVMGETAAPDPDNDVDSDDNGATSFTGNAVNHVASQAITLGPAANEPTGEVGPTPNPAGEAPDAQSNRTVDFGFYRQELGNVVFTDVNNNGIYNVGTDGLLAGVTVQLFASNGTTQINVGPDGILGTADDAAGGVVTGVGGAYQFAGLPQGNYIVKVTPPSGYISTVDTADAADTTDPDTNTDNNDNGIGTTAGQVSSGVVTLTPGQGTGGSAGAVNNVVTNATGTTIDPTVDFGFTPPLFSLGNRVWFDTDNSSTINGTEAGINGVTVQLYAADAGGNPTGAVLATQTTANGGYYRFDNLAGGDYVVVIPASQFGAGGVLDGYWSSSTTISGAGVLGETVAPDPDNNVDNDDNGTLQIAGAFNGAVLSNAVTLGPTNNEPINDTDADPTNPAGESVNNQSNRTVDFGFYRQSLGNVVFSDVNNNGTYNIGTDGLLAGATVQLYASDGATEINVGPDGILGTADDAAGGVITPASGIYTFSGLPAGDYVVKVTPPTGYISTIDTANAADTTDPDTNTDNNDNGVGTGTGQVSSGVVTLTPGQGTGGTAGAANNVVTNATGTTTDPTVDFGFVPPLFSLGNRVWFDTDNSGTINGTEAGVDGVTVQLYAADAGGNPTGAALGTEVTANDGYYRFDNLAGGDYVVVIPASQFGAAGVLDGYWSSGTTISGAGVVGETVAPDPDNNVDSDDNGNLQTAGAFNGAVLSNAITLGPSNNEPINDADADPTNPAGEAVNNQSNRTVDFGFYRQQLGNVVFADVNNNGTYDAGDTTIAGATVQLYASNGTTEINVGPDGILGTADDAAGGVTTIANGLYSFSGLPAGDYVVKVTPPPGYISTVDTAAAADTTAPNTNTDNNDNGVGTGAGQVSSNTVTLIPGSTGAAGNNTVSDATGTTTNPTVDFGFTPPLFSLGNRIWFDSDNSGTINGTEVGVNGVTVQLYAADAGGNPTGAVLDTQVTANGGYYRFDNLAGGDYVVVIPASQFGTGGALEGYLSSGTTISGAGVLAEVAAPDPGNNVDSDDNGTLQTAGAFNGGVISNAITLGPTANEPINDTDADPTNPAGEAPDAQSNRTVDFGFYRQELGNVVFVDVNNNGTYDAGDITLAGATVQLYASNGTTEINVGPDGILGTADDAAGGFTTLAGGAYLFSGLPAGDYIVKVTPPSGYTSTVDTANAADTTDPDTNTDNNDNGIGTAAGQVRSAVVTLTPGQGAGGSAGAANNVVTNATGTTTDPTVDFGFRSPAFSLGNRVWFDTDNSGTINGTESGVNGVTVQVYAADAGGNPTGAVLGTQTTANGGYYRFDNLPAGDYVVVIPASEFGAGGQLDGYLSSGTTINGTGVLGEAAAPDPDNDSDSDDNGTLQTAGAFTGAVISNAITLGPGTTEPINDTDADPTNPAGEAVNNQSNRTVDFGFYRQQLGNLVFIDVNNNGTYDAGDTTLAGAAVQLYASDGTTEINVGPDGILGTADDAAGGVVTGAAGTYLFSGLPQGDYIVKVIPPVGYASAVDTADAADSTDPNTNTNNNDNGVGTGLGQVFSNAVTLTPGNIGAAANNTVTNATGTTTNPTIDFGFVPFNGLAKAIIGTDQAFTTGNNVAIGEIVTYEITIDLPVGVALNNVTVTDRMDKGLAFVDCLSVTLAGANVTGTVCPPTVSSITDPGDLVTNPANPGRQVLFTIGNIPAPVAASTLVIAYRAILLDVIENQDGDTLNNSVTWAWTGGSFSTSAPNVTIVEPDLDIDKSATPTTVTAGTSIQFTLVINHTAQSSADAFDIVVTDIMPAGLEYIPCTVVYAGLAPTTPPAVPAPYCPAAATNLTFVWDSFPLGQSATITFNARLDGTQPSVTNTASLAWTSLLIDPAGIPPQPVQLSTHNPTSTERAYDPGDPVNTYQAISSIGINSPAIVPSAKVDLPDALPATGFAPNVTTTLPQQPTEKLYAATDVWMEIPSLGVSLPIVGVPLVDGDWDVSWLDKQAGWLNGTAFPGWDGNSVLTGHVYLANGKPGPFVELGKLKWGDKIIVHAYGSVYTYEVRENRTVSPTNTSAFKHEEDSWLTLITCKTYKESTNTYTSRIAVRATLVSVLTDKQDGIPKNSR